MSETQKQLGGALCQTHTHKKKKKKINKGDIDWNRYVFREGREIALGT